MVRRVSASAATVCLSISVALLFSISLVAAAQSTKNPGDPPHQIIATAAGMIVIDLPDGWEQSEGQGLAFFLPKGVRSENAVVWMYISAAPVGPDQDDKDTESYIKSDVAGFKQHFKHGVARLEESLATRNKAIATIYSFQSGEKDNAFEEVAYLPDAGRVWTITVSARNAPALEQSLADFRRFVGSYGGSILFGSPK